MAKRFVDSVKPLRSVRTTVPESVERAVTKAMSIDIATRFKTTAQFGQALASNSLATPSDTATLPAQTVSSAKSVAVLPFSNMSNDAENEYFADGMAEEIINALSRFSRCVLRQEQFPSLKKDGTTILPKSERSSAFRLYSMEACAAWAIDFVSQHSS
jgi:hypothetical protein